MWRGGNEIEQWGMLTVEAGIALTHVLAKILAGRHARIASIWRITIRTAAHRIRKWRTGNPVPMPLLPALADASRFESVRFLHSAKLRPHQPNRLCQEQAKQKAGKELRTSEALAREISTHKGEPSVLPCRSPLRGNF